ncbi:MAG TPA: suppressor of fused domain protein [Pirellulales bacterium]|nr:suppressor of fused domain protein [Pirellulales bacterium]
MTQNYDSELIERVARAIRDGNAGEVRRLLTEHPECLVFLDFRERVTDADIDSWIDYAEQCGHEEMASMFRFDFPDRVRWAINDAASEGNLQELKRVLAEHPRYLAVDRDHMLSSAAWNDHIDVVEFLLASGGEINTLYHRSTPLERAVGNASREMVEYLLLHAADPNIGRPIIGAINREPDESALEIVRLLVEHGADVNREYRLYDTDTTFTALEWAAGKSQIAEYLRSKGAVEQKKKVRDRAAVENLADEVIAYFKENFGPPQPQAQIEIVPTEPPIAIHVIPAAENRKHVTLFTTGMSEQPMSVPEGTDDFRFAELFIQLPGNWPIDKKSLSNPKHAWPIHWLRSIAKYPHERDTWLGGPVTIIANGDPPEPLAPGLKFTSLLVMADRNFTSRDGRTIYLYRLLPLYTEERELELKQGVAALMRAFDKHDIPSVVDLTRPNVAVQGR